MKSFSTYMMFFGLAAIAVGAGCNNSKKETQVVAAVPQDTMLLRDLAEANRNTAMAAAADNSLNTVRTTDDALTGAQSPTPETHVVERPSPAASQVLTSGTRTIEAGSSNGSAQPAASASPPAASPPATVTRRPPRTTSTSTSSSSSGDPCDSPAPVDQRTCLNRSIVENDADLNRTYQELIEQSRKSGGPDLEERFRQAQREWINTRDRECLEKTGGQGALWARARGRCLAEYSDRRTAELRNSLNSLRGQ
jgi:uncharacterized protein YecT (DUF1311 family)